MTVLLTAKKIQVNADKAGVTPLMLAVQMARWPLAIEPSPQRFPGFPLSSAQERKKRIQPLALVKLLMSRGANPDRNAPGDSAWHWAVWMHLPQVANLLDPTAHLPDDALPWIPLQIAAGSGRTCALMSDTTVACWGTQWRMFVDMPAEPQPVAGIVGARALSLHGLCAQRDADVTCFGGLGIPSHIPVKSLQQVAIFTDRLIGLLPGGVLYGSKVALPPSVKSLIGYGSRACAIVLSGKVQCWSEEMPQWHDESEHDMPSDVKGIVGSSSIALSTDQGCAVLTDGAVACWPEHDWWSKLPAEATATSLGLSNVAEIALGPKRGCARKNDGTVVCWGASTLEEGENHIAPQHQVPNLVAIALAVGDTHVCAITWQHAVVCWGQNDLLGTTPTPSEYLDWITVPKLVPL